MELPSALETRGPGADPEATLWSLTLCQFSVTLYGTDNKLLIPNDKKVYDRTTYSAEPNKDGTYALTLSPSGDGKNGLPTGKDFYAILRAYVPSPNAVMKVSIKKQ